jgi:DNA-binding SARP family transcriptional activator/Tfp pilus assembly protein PilF
MDFRILGPLQVGVAGRQVVVSTAPKRLRVLAALLARAGQPVPVDSLVEAVWGQRPPASARRNLQQYVHGLRQILGAGLIATRGDSYLLAPGSNLDSVEFRRLATDGAAALEAGDIATAATGLRAALDLWRGPAFAEFLDCELVAEEAARLELLRLETFERWAEAQLVTGAASRLAAELAEMVRRHPYREGLRALLMRALYQTGRRVEALTVFRETRALLVDQVGMEPGLPLRQLHEAMLRGDATLESTIQEPRQLPAPPQRFTGRIAELAALDRVHNASTVVISAIDGMAGIGKTALAIQAAHRLADRYQDGQLFIDLHGYTQGLKPTEPAEALDHLLRALGVPGAQIPASLDARAALYRTRLADQRMLIVLDNAATENQVAPLLPGTSGSLVLVTSRRRLAGLDHTHTLSLDTLPASEAVTLLVETAGEGRLAEQPPDLLREVVELCGRLPLAIRIAAARMRSHPTWSLARLVELLRDRRHRLAELAAGQRSVTAALELSYQHLDTDQQQAYRRLGLHPGPEIDAYATAALLDSNLRHANRMLDQLLHSNLMVEPAAGRYRFHDLTRAHAAQTARDQTEPTTRKAALDRLLHHYRHTAARAMDAAYPYEREHRPRVPPAQTPTPELPGPDVALEWLDTELPNLLATARFAADRGSPAHIRHLPNILHRYLRGRGRYQEAETLHRLALATARAAGDRSSELEALVGVGHIYRRQGRYAEATVHLEQALQIAGATGDHPGTREALTGLGWIHRMHGQYEQAADRFGLALRLARTTGHRPGEREALYGLGDIDLLQGRYEQAADHYQQALQVARAIGDRFGELNALNGLGQICRTQGRYEQAADHHQQALRIARATGYRLGEQHALAGLGDLYRRQGQHARAGYHLQQLLQLAQESADRGWQLEAWHSLGRLQLATGDPDTAVAYHDRALVLAHELGHPDDQARAHDGLAHAHQALNQHEQARSHWQHALEILTTFGIENTEDEETTVPVIRAHLASLDQRDGLR